MRSYLYVVQVGPRPSELVGPGRATLDDDLDALLLVKSVEDVEDPPSIVVVATAADENAPHPLPFTISVGPGPSQMVPSSLSTWGSAPNPAVSGPSQGSGNHGGRGCVRIALSLARR